jgi:hypothetical protein
MLAFGSAAGATVPPAYIFPRVHFKDHMLTGAPVGSFGLASPSGWINEGLFFEAIKHFQRHIKCSKEDRCLLVLDSHEAHISLAVIDFCRDNGIDLLTLPPHTSNKLQPLDISVFGPMKQRFRNAQNNFMLSARRPITIYDIAALSCGAYNDSFTVRNLTQGFQKCGIYPLNENVFSEDDFIISSVTDRPPGQESHVTTESVTVSIETSSVREPAGGSSAVLMPQDVVPFPKCSPRKSTKRGGGKRRYSSILTDSPVKAALFPSSKTTEKELCDDDSDADDWIPEEEHDIDEELLATDQVAEGDYVLVRFATKKTSVYYAGRVQELAEDHIMVKFLRRVRQTQQFVFPDEDDTSNVSREDIFWKLPSPSSAIGTKRTANSIRFTVDFATMNVK